MAKEGLSFNMAVSGLYSTLAALNVMPDEAKSELKDAAFELSQDIAQAIRAAAHAAGHQGPLLAGTVSWGSDSGDDSDLPEVQAGGSSRLGRRAKPAFKMLFGSEFGATYLKQFRPRNTVGYWFYPTVDRMSDEITSRWSEAADKVITEFSEE